MDWCGVAAVRRPRKEIAAAGILALEILAAAILGIVIWHTDHPRPPHASWVVATFSAPGATQPLSTASATVHSAPPLRLTAPAIALDAKVTPYTVAEAANGADGVTGKPCLVDGVITCVDPASARSAVWQVGGVAGVAFGSEPGTDSTGTVYVYGHAASGVGAVFNGIEKLKPGDDVTMTTANGKLTYRVQRTVITIKSAFASTPEAVDQVPGRLLLISCDHGPGARLVNGGYSTGNIVVVLQLEQP